MRGRPPVRRLPADRRGDASGLLSPFQSAPILDLPGSTGGQCTAIGVRTYPGQMALTRIPDCAYSTAQRFSQANNPPLSLGVRRFAQVCCTISPVTEDIITIQPIFAGNHLRQHRLRDVPYAFYIGYQYGNRDLHRSISRKLPRRQTPALFIRISSRPLLFLFSALNSCGCSTPGHAISATTAASDDHGHTVRPPVFSIPGDIQQD